MSGGNKKFVINNQSPYFSHPSEGPGVIITIVIFNENYQLWQRAVRTALRSKNKLGFIDGIITKPQDDPNKLNA